MNSGVTTEAGRLTQSKPHIRAVRDGRRFAVAFIDVRMPPGIDGRETARRIRAIDPDVQIVIVTGYSDFSPAQIARVAGPPDRLFYIAKPFTADTFKTTIDPFLA